MEAALNAISPDVGYHDWVSIGMAIDAGSGGSDEGVQLWAEWSAESEKYVEGEPEGKWASFNGQGIGVGILHRLPSSTDSNRRVRRRLNGRRPPHA
jgi:hypothetical protein